MRVVDFQNPPVASSETARYINRRIVLNLIRRRQPISRADLARFSGLQRSTVSAISEQLLEEKWITKGATGRLPRGRRPTFLRLNNKRAIICVDIRPARITLAVADINGHFSSSETIPTPPKPQTALRELTVRIRQLIKSRGDIDFEGIGVSLPGRIDLRTQELIFAPNLRWPACDLKTPLAGATGLEVDLENAANACAMAEIWFGNAGQVTSLVALTVSEGIGAGVIANGQLLRGHVGMAGEFGHMPLDPAGPLCSCGNRGCWEVLGSNRAAVRYYLESAATDNQIEFQDLLARASHGDVRAGKALDTMAGYVARGVQIVVAGLAPEAIVFVGELTADWNRFQPVIETAAKAQAVAGNTPRIIAAKEGAMARLRGTVALVLYKHFGVPQVS